MDKEITEKYPQQLLDLVSDIIAEMRLPKFLAENDNRAQVILDAVKAQDSDLSDDIALAVQLLSLSATGLEISQDEVLEEKTQLRLKILINRYLENLVKKEQDFYTTLDKKREIEASSSIVQHEKFVDDDTAEALNITASLIKDYQLGLDVIRLETILKTKFGQNYQQFKEKEKAFLIQWGWYNEETGNTALFNSNPDLATQKMDLLFVLYIKQKDIFTNYCNAIQQDSKISAKDKKIISRLSGEILAIITKDYSKDPKGLQNDLITKIASKDFQNKLKKCDKSIGHKFIELLAKIFTLGFKKPCVATNVRFTNAMNSTITMYAELSKATSHKIDDDSESTSESKPCAVLQ